MDILVILTFILLVLFGIGDAFKLSAIKIGSSTLLTIVILIGWLLYGTSAFEKRKYTKIDEYSLIKLEEQIEVRLKEKTYIFDKQIDFQNIKDTTTFFIEKKTNLFGIRKFKKAFYKIENNKYYSK